MAVPFSQKHKLDSDAALEIFKRIVSKTPNLQLGHSMRHPVELMLDGQRYVVDIYSQERLSEKASIVRALTYVVDWPIDGDKTPSFCDGCLEGTFLHPFEILVPTTIVTEGDEIVFPETQTDPSCQVRATAEDAQMHNMVLIRFGLSNDAEFQKQKDQMINMFPSKTEDLL